MAINNGSVQYDNNGGFLFSPILYLDYTVDPSAYFCMVRDGNII